MGRLTSDGRYVVDVEDRRRFEENGFVHRHEEIGMPVEWVPLADAVEKALMGMIHNSPAVAGILAAYAASVDGFGLMRPADAPEA